MSFLTRGGLWSGAWNRLDDTSFGDDKRVYKHRPLASDGTPTGDWEVFSATPDIAALQNKPRSQNFMATGTVAWFRFATSERGTSNDVSTIAGYDTRTKRWIAPTPPTPAYPNSAAVYATETADGGAVIGIANAPVSVLRYRPGADKWKPVATAAVPTARADEGFRAILAPDDAVYAITGKEVCEYVPARREWVRIALPTGLLPSGDTVQVSELRVAATTKAVYVGTNETGLWRWDRLRRLWQTVREPLRWSPDARTGTTCHLNELAADKHAVWAAGGGYSSQSVLVRWDRTTKTARYLRETDTGISLAGVPRVVTAGDTTLLWQPQKPGIYRATPGTPRFSRVSDVAPLLAQAAPDDLGTVFFLAPEALHRYTERDRRVTALTPNGAGIAEPLSLGGGLVVTKNAVYAGSAAGVHRYDRKTGKRSLVPRTETLLVQSMRRDGDTLIVSSESATARVSLR